MLCTIAGCFTLDPRRYESEFYSDGRYQNLYDDAAIVEKGLHTVLYWKLFGEEDEPAVNPLPLDPPEVRPVQRDLFYPPEGILRVIWLGHSTTWIAATVNSRTYHLVLDPVLEGILTRPRIVSLPIEKEALPAADAVLVSHAHRDHLDVSSLSFLAARSGKTRIFLPSGMGRWAEEEGFDHVIQEWWERNPVGPFDVQYVPAQHWSRMGVNDTMQYHWGGYWITIGGRSVFFAGDTAYSPHFKDIRNRRGDRLDLAIMPIGAFKPRWFMKAAHIDPPEALQASADLQAQQMVPIHWGTFGLGDDAPRESSLYLEKLVKDGKVPDGLEVFNWEPGQYLDYSIRQ